MLGPRVPGAVVVGFSKSSTSNSASHSTAKFVPVAGLLGGWSLILDVSRRRLALHIACKFPTSSSLCYLRGDLPIVSSTDARCAWQGDDTRVLDASMTTLLRCSFAQVPKSVVKVVLITVCDQLLDFARKEKRHPVTILDLLAAWEDNSLVLHNVQSCEGVAIRSNARPDFTSGVVSSRLGRT